MPVTLDALPPSSLWSPERLTRLPRTIATAGLALALIVGGGEGHDARAQGSSPSPGPAPGSLSTGPMVAAGGGTSFVLKANGTVLGWGSPSGVDGFGAFPSPIRPAGVDSVTAVAAGQYHTLALRRDGSALGWGNASEGRLGDGSSGRTR